MAGEMSSRSFGQALRQHRQAAGLSQEALAARAGLSSQAIGALERGERKYPYSATVLALAAALELPEAVQADLLAIAVRRRSAAPRPSGAFPSAAPIPIPLTPLLGRDADVAAISDLICSARLVTLTGPGGVGKTRLALHIAARLRERFFDGAVFVPLAPLNYPVLVLPAIAQALGVADSGAGTVSEMLRHALPGRHLLVVLDNCEHLPGCASEVAALLQACPDLAILATSRSPLRVRGEQQYTVTPLSLPPADRAATVGAAGEFAAIRLFVERACAVIPGFALTEENVEPVAGICRRLDGLPLALELAAPHIKLLPPQALLRRLTHRLGLLTGGSEDLPSRQQTFRNVVEWSFSLLSPREQTLFAQLAVFSGGFTLEDVEAVCDGTDLLEGLASLVSKSLVQQAGSESPYLYLLQTMREFAAEKLTELGEAERIGSAHAAYFSSMAEEAGRELRGPHSSSRVARLEGALDNIRVALWWFLDHGSATDALRLATALQPFWRSRGHWTEGQHWLEGALALNGGDVAARAAATLVLGTLLTLKGECARATLVLTSAAGDLHELHDVRGTAEALSYLSLTAFWQGDFERARDCLIRSQPLWTGLDDRAQYAGFLGMLGAIEAELGKVDEAREHLEAAVRLARETGVPDRLSLELALLGYLAYHQGYLSEAETLLEEARAVAESVDAKRLLAYALLGLGLVAAARDQLDEASTALERALRLSFELGYLYCTLLGLTALAMVALASGELERAAHLKGAEARLRGQTDIPVPPCFRTHHGDTLAGLRTRLDEETFARAYAVAEAMSLQDAVAYALGESDCPVHPLKAKLGHSNLSHRSDLSPQ